MRAGDRVGYDFRPLPTTDPPSHRRLAFVAIALLTLAAHGVDVTHPFTNWDDLTLLCKNEVLHPVTAHSLWRIWSGPVEGLYTPLAYTLWAAGLQITQSPWLFHAMNLLLHTASVGLVLAILLRLTRGRLIESTIAAAVFAVHPLQAEAVAWVAGMNNVLAGMLSLASVLFWIGGGADRNARRTAFWTTASIVLFFLACLSKPTAIVTPLVILVIDLLILRRRPRPAIAVMLLLVVVFAVIARFAQQSAGVMTPTPPQRLMVAGDSLGFYLQKLVWPVSLYVDYGRTPESVIATGGSIAGWTALAVATVGAGLTLKRRPWIAGAFGVFVGGICLVLGLVPFDFQIYSTVADRYLYLSMLGPAILIAFALRSAPRPVFVVAGALVLGLAAMTVRQSQFWSSSETLMAHQNANNPDSLASHAILAGLANRDNNPAEAEKHYRAFLAIRPSDVTVNGQLADLLRESGRYGESLQYYKAAFDNGQHTALLFNNWGLSLWKLNRHHEAADAFARALAENPDNFNANLNLGLMQANLGQLDQAAQHLQRATELDPSSAIARDSLAKVQALRARLQNR